MKTSKSPFAMERVTHISLSDLHEWNENPIKRKDISDKELRQSIQDNGLTVDALAVVPNGMGYIVVDGNRRLRIAKELELSGEVFAKVYSRNVDKVALAIYLNGVGSPWDRQSYVQFVVGHPERIDALPVRYRGVTRKMYDLLGDDFEWFANNCRPNAFDWGVQLATYLGKKDDDAFVKKTVLWVGKHKLVREARRALDSNAPKSMIAKAIMADKPIRITVTVA